MSGYAVDNSYNHVYSLIHNTDHQAHHYDQKH